MINRIINPGEDSNSRKSNIVGALIFSLNSIIILLSKMLFYLIIKLFMLVFGFESERVMNIYDYSFLGFAIFYLFDAAFVGAISGYIQSVLFLKKSSRDWSIYSGVFWCISVVIYVLFLVILGVSEDFLGFDSPVTALSMQLIGAAILGAMVGIKQSNITNKVLFYKNRWILINILRVCNIRLSNFTTAYAFIIIKWTSEIDRSQIIRGSVAITDDTTPVVSWQAAGFTTSESASSG